MKPYDLVDIHMGLLGPVVSTLRLISLLRVGKRVRFPRGAGRCTVGSKIIRALAIIHVNFHWFDCLFYHLMLVINSIKAKDHDLTNI